MSIFSPFFFGGGPCFLKVNLCLNSVFLLFCTKNVKLEDFVNERAWPS